MAALSGSIGPSSPPAHPEINNYDVDDDIFAYPELEPGNESQSKKRKGAAGLGIDEEVAVAKKARAPNVKLDEERLLSAKGIPTLRRKAKDLRLKGKGHEFSDASRLLSFYQLWLDDLFPKAKFTDALAMVEKLGHKKVVQLKRVDWINEGKPGADRKDDDDDLFSGAHLDEERDTAVFPAKVAPIFQNGNQGGRPKTPTGENLFGDDDIYGASPSAQKKTQPSGAGGDMDEEEDLDALLAEEEASRAAPKSLFGNGIVSVPSRPRHEPEEDDLDALMAEAEAFSTENSNKPQRPAEPRRSASPDGGDELDALIADAEAGDDKRKNQPGQAEGQAGADKVPDEDEMAEMAEMEGLW